MFLLWPRMMMMSSVIPQPIATINVVTNQQTSSTTLVISKPAGTMDGDLMIAMMTSDAGTSSWTGDTNWGELLDTNVSATVCLRIAAKVATTEGSSYTFTHSTSSNLSGAIVSFRYAVLDAIGAASTLANNPVAPQLTMSKNGSLLVGFYACASASVSFSPPGGMSGLIADNDATAPSWALVAEAVNSGATGTRQSTSSPGTSSAGVLIGVKPFYP